MFTFTLDTNCVIDVAEGRPAGRAIQLLVDAHSKANANVALVAISASERQKGDRLIEDFSEFRQRLTSLNLALELVFPMTYWDISFWDHSLLADEAMACLEQRIHSILFPAVQFLWQDYCRENGIEPTGKLPFGKWRNCKCDVQAIWSHIHARRDVFVTSDENFLGTKKDKLISLGAGKIETPDSALILLS